MNSFSFSSFWKDSWSSPVWGPVEALPTVHNSPKINSLLCFKIKNFFPLLFIFHPHSLSALFDCCVHIIISFFCICNWRFDFLSIRMSMLLCLNLSYNTRFYIMLSYIEICYISGMLATICSMVCYVATYRGWSKVSINFWSPPVCCTFFSFKLDLLLVWCCLVMN